MPNPHAPLRATSCWQYRESDDMPEFTAEEMEVVPVSWADVPMQTQTGTVWMSPIKRAHGFTGCDRCPLVDLCQEAVAAGGYCGCERVLVGELIV